MDPITISAMTMLTSLGQYVAKEHGPKLVEVAVPLLKGAVGRIAFKFLPHEVAQGANDVIRSIKPVKEINLSQNLDVLDNGLSVAANFVSNQFVGINQKISDDLSIVKGQNEILFLSHSIEYFVNSHRSKIGIDTAISYALQYDIKAVFNHIKANPKIRFPGYLLHQCNSLAETIKQYNIFFDSILDDGFVKDWNEEIAFAELSKTYGANRDANPFSDYIPAEYQIKWKRLNESKSRTEQSWVDKVPFFGSDEEILDESHNALMILAGELVANEALEDRVTKKIEKLDGRKLLIHVQSEQPES